jgi:hypothetical protein
MSRLINFARHAILIILIAWGTNFAVGVLLRLAGFASSTKSPGPNVVVPLPPPVPLLGAEKQPDESGAARNIYLAASSLSHCPWLEPTPGMLDRYADENGVDIGSVVRSPTQNRYDRERATASTIIETAIRVGGKPGLCRMLAEQFGGEGTFVPDLLRLKNGGAGLFDDLIPK